MKRTTKKRLSICLSLTLVLSLLYTASPVNPAKVAKATDYGLSNPRTDSDGVATWDCIYFGNYWQNDTNGDGKADKNDAKQPIKWRVLSVEGDDAFLLADQNLDCQKYNEEYAGVTWETCTLRQWLNNDFYQNAFDSSEQSAVRTTTVVNENNPHPEYGKEGGNNTSDNVYLLSISEASNTAYGFHGTYSIESKTREAKNTAYTKCADPFTDYSSDSFAGNGGWWLRSPGFGSNYAAGVSHDGYVTGAGINVVEFYAVRPALHLNLSSFKWSKAGTVSSSVDGSAEGTATPEPTPTPTPVPTATHTPVPTGGETAAPTPDNAEPAVPTATPVPTGGETAAPTPDNGKPATPTVSPTPVPPQGEKTAPTSGSSSTAENKVAVTAPAKGVLKNCKNKTGKKISLSWKKIKDAKGYQIQYADNGKWKKKKSKWTKKTTYTIKKLKKKKTYYIRVRAYKLDGSKKVYGSWSKAKKVKVKK